MDDTRADVRAETNSEQRAVSRNAKMTEAPFVPKSAPSNPFSKPRKRKHRKTEGIMVDFL
jgi:hypothetical protein